MSIVDRLRDRISYEKLQVDIIPEKPKVNFYVDLFLHLQDKHTLAPIIISLRQMLKKKRLKIMTIYFVKRILMPSKK